MNPAQQLCSSAQRHPAAAAVTQGHVTWRYGEFAERVARTASFIASATQGAPGARVGIAMENCPGFLQILYACWHACACAVPMNAKLHPREFAYILENAGAALCFASPSLYPGIAAELGERHATRAIEANAPSLERLAQGASMALAASRADDPAWLFYTSGTTGRPKGASLTVRNLMFMSLAYYADVDRLDERDCMLHAAPLSHGSGLYALPHIARGSHQIIPAGGHFSAGEMFELIERYPRVSFFAAPTMLVRMLDDGAATEVNWAGLKTILYGGAPMYVADLERALGLLGPRLYQIYGQGESPMTITGLDQRAHECAWAAGDRAALGSAGTARSGVEVRVVDAAEERALGAGEVGEIVTRSDCVMQGYWMNAQASADALRGGWLHTGDLGSMDEHGVLTLRDRSKDLIISGGSNIYPREVEEVLLRSPKVAQASVVGAPHPQWGEEVIAFVVPVPGAGVTVSELDALCLQHIARYKRPRRYEFVDDLPKNNYGKVLKTALRERAAGASSIDREDTKCTT